MKRKYFVDVPMMLFVVCVILFLVFLCFCASNDAKRAKYNLEREAKIVQLQLELNKAKLENLKLEEKVKINKE